MKLWSTWFYWFLKPKEEKELWSDFNKRAFFQALDFHHEESKDPLMFLRGSPHDSLFLPQLFVEMQLKKMN